MSGEAEAESAAAQAFKDTPMMEQYFKIKAEHAGFLLFYRMGDFYELFFDDALIAAKALNIALTARGKRHGKDIPMCGVPVFAAEDYLQKLIAANYRIAVCEQMEDPAEAKKRGAKSVVRREVVRLVTPGTITEDRLLAPERANYLMAAARAKGAAKNRPAPAGGGAAAAASPPEAAAEEEFALAWLDISTGIFRVSSCGQKRLLADILRIEPQELIIADSLYREENLRPLLDIVGKAVTPQPDSLFETSTAARRICVYYHVATLEGFADFSKAELKAIAAVLAYVEKTQIHERPPLSRPLRENAGRQLFIDAATAANLELVRTLSGKAQGSLLKAIDRTLTGGGARLLLERLTAPLNVAAEIEDRLDCVSFFLKEADLRAALRKNLDGVADILRALSRLALGRGGPRDFAAALQALEAAKAIRHIFALGAEPPHELEQALEALEALPDAWRKKLKAALAEDLPLLKRDGGFIRAGYHAELDELRRLKHENHRIIAAMQAELARETGIKNLKIKHNNILGYFIEVSAAQAAPLIEGEAAKARFIHRQSMANAMRFATADLAALEQRINSAADGALAIELQIFEELTEDIKNYADDIREGAQALAALDVAAALAVLAAEQNYCRPRIDESLAFAVQGGRHPVVEQALRGQSAQFIANNCCLSPQGEYSDGQKAAHSGAAADKTAHSGAAADKTAHSEAAADNAADAGSIWLLTGPNMGGKSTFLRQNALIMLMAQMGSFVPAESAHIGIADRLFSRVGAADDLARGRSTFMVEMVETAAILNQATPRSLVILDEIGRGTATFDGLSIAWASLEYLHNVNRCRALFATHFHELTILAKTLPRLSNHTMKVREWHNDVIFLHEVEQGAADRSYGVQVAKLAGLPQAVIARAREVLAQLERQTPGAQTAAVLQDLPLFSAAGLADFGGNEARNGQKGANGAAGAAQAHNAAYAQNGRQARNAPQMQNGAYAQNGAYQNTPEAQNGAHNAVPTPFLKAAQQNALGERKGGIAAFPAAALYSMPETETAAPAAFAAPPALPAEARALLEAVAELDPDSLTPRAALDALYRLKTLLKSSP